MDKRVAMIVFSVASSVGSWLAIEATGGTGDVYAAPQPNVLAIERKVHIGDSVFELAKQGIVPDKTLPTAGDPDSLDWIFVDRTGVSGDLIVRLTDGVVSNVEHL